ncbi:MAG TPA: glycosyltransferase [Pirellulales bacterium]|nr:glycosyltransferase [Pirellulales bacterium]
MRPINEPLVSILIPCFNAEKYVGEAIESALAQTYPRIEVVVVDDGSTDGSLDVIRSFGRRIRCETGPKRGACAARNQALRLSGGEFIQFLDADDLLEPMKIAMQLPMLLADEADIVLCRGLLFGDTRPACPIKRIVLPTPTADAFIFLLNHPVGTENPLHRRSCLEKVGGFREDLPRAQEGNLHCRLGAAGARLRAVDALLFRHRDHNGPRVSLQPQTPGYLCWFMISLLKELESGPPYQFMKERRAALAGSLFQQAIFAYRDGAIEIAREGFKCATRLSSNPDYVERAWYKALVRALGPMRTEQLLATARRYLRGHPKRESTSVVRVV